LIFKLFLGLFFPSQSKREPRRLPVCVRGARTLGKRCCNSRKASRAWSYSRCTRCKLATDSRAAFQPDSWARFAAIRHCAIEKYRCSSLAQATSLREYTAAARFARRWRRQIAISSLASRLRPPRCSALASSSSATSFASGLACAGVHDIPSTGRCSVSLSISCSRASLALPWGGARAQGEVFFDSALAASASAAVGIL